MRDGIRFRVSFVVPFILLLASGSGPVATANGAAPTHTIIDLGTLGGPGGRVALEINARGQAVGNSTTAAGESHVGLSESNAHLPIH